MRNFRFEPAFYESVDEIYAAAKVMAEALYNYYIK